MAFNLGIPWVSSIKVGLNLILQILILLMTNQKADFYQQEQHLLAAKKKWKIHINQLV